MQVQVSIEQVTIGRYSGFTISAGLEQLRWNLYILYRTGYQDWFSDELRRAGRQCQEAA